MRYLAFSGHHYEASGGWYDLQDDFDREHNTLQEAIQQACSIALRQSHDWIQVVDLDARQIVFQAG